MSEIRKTPPLNKMLDFNRKQIMLFSWLPTAISPQSLFSMAGRWLWVADLAIAALLLIAVTCPKNKQGIFTAHLRG